MAEIGQRLGKQALEEVATVVKPDTILAWHRKLRGAEVRWFQAAARLPDGPRSTQEWKRWWSAWHTRIVPGDMIGLSAPSRISGYTISDQTVGNILKRHGIPPAPERKTTTTWKEFIRTHLDVLVATDFFTAEVWTLAGLVTYYVLFFIHLSQPEGRMCRRHTASQ